MSDGRGKRDRRTARKQQQQAREILARIAERQAQIGFDREMRTAR